VPRIAFVNKMDRTGANFENALNDMRKKLGAYAYPIFLPIGKEDYFQGVIDVVNQKAIVYDLNDEVGLKYEVTEIPAELKDNAKAALAELIDAVSNKDDAIAELVIEEKPVTPEILKAAIRRLTCKIELVPVLCGSAFKKRGVQPLVDAVVDYLPSPLDVPPPTGEEPGNPENKIEVPSDDGRKFCSLAFKLWTDPYVGKLVFFRTYSGTLKKGDNIYNPRTRKRERVSRVMMIQADKRIDVDTVYAGDIAALVGLRNITTGDTLCDEDFEVLLEPPTFPEPVISMAVEAKTKGDREKCPKVFSVSRRKTRLSVVSPTRKPASLSSPAWASCTWKSSATACSGNSRSKPLPAHRRSLIAKRSQNRLMARVNSSASLVAAASTVMPVSRFSPTNGARAWRSRTRLSVARFQGIHRPGH